MKGRYIKADALKERLIQNITLTNAIDRSFREAPSIDIVFCKECNNYVGCHCESEVMWGSIYGEIAGCEYMVREPDGFCSYGEREGE